MSARARNGLSPRESKDETRRSQQEPRESRVEEDLFQQIFRFSEDDGRPSSGLRFRRVSDGYWLVLLLPLAVYLSEFDIEKKWMTLFAVGIIVWNSCILSIFRWLDLDFSMILVRLRRINIVLGVIIMGICVFHGGHIYEIASHVVLNFTFPYIFYNIIKQHPKSFSFGEGVLVTSAFSYQFWKTSQNLPFPSTDTPIYLQEENAILEFVLQLAFFGTVLGARVVLLLMKPWKLFVLEEMLCLWAKYCSMAFFIRVPVINDEVAIFLLMWPFRFLVATRLRVKLLVYWGFISCLTGAFLIHKVYTTRRRTTTVDRKVFHFAIVFVFLPGIIWDITMLYCCSAVLFFLMTIFEVARVLKFEIIRIKIGDMIDEKVKIFRDRQDSGRLLLTPIYLLVGCAVPIWLTGLSKQHSDLSPIQYAACLTGILSIGIGDTFASLGGTYFGRTRWGGSRKTVEGTLSSIITQVLVAMLIFMSGLIPYDTVSALSLMVAIIVNAFVEGNTDQIDNLVLPLVAYSTVHLFSIACTHSQHKFL